MAKSSNPSTLRLEDDILTIIRILAKREKRSIPAEINYLLEQYIKLNYSTITDALIALDDQRKDPHQ